jgi:hypothetical protein
VSDQLNFKVDCKNCNTDLVRRRARGKLPFRLPKLYDVKLEIVPFDRKDIYPGLGRKSQMWGTIFLEQANMAAQLHCCGHNVF